ncbi:MAG: nickel pincer cofactor biosynthesis protein LarB [Candidatus Nealsonbacteria bacterium]|nr:nickel pincer cofactor biosynthesis protein LarB [Candidatus Nealsonbacteria bacterium]
MTPKAIKKILKDFRAGEISEKEVFRYLKSLPFKDLSFAKIDHHRALRRGFPETIFGKGKTKDQILKISEEMARYGNVLITKTSEDVFKAIKEKYPKSYYNKLAKTIVIKNGVIKTRKGKILILAAGTSDIPVAEEAAVTAELFGNKVENVYDVGVAGIHRLFANLDKISKSSVIIVVAGMEGALPSVVAGLTDKAVIAVPTSCGYGASFEGITPLLAMLNSCSPGVAVVNIDNGFGAGYLASLINK